MVGDNVEQKTRALMDSRSYNDSNQDRYGTVHREITEFVIDVALYHNQLDESHGRFKEITNKKTQIYEDIFMDRAGAIGAWAGNPARTTGTLLVEWAKKLTATAMTEGRTLGTILAKLTPYFENATNATDLVTRLCNNLKTNQWRSANVPDPLSEKIIDFLKVCLLDIIKILDSRIPGASDTLFTFYKNFFASIYDTHTNHPRLSIDRGVIGTVASGGTPASWDQIYAADPILTIDDLIKHTSHHEHTKTLLEAIARDSDSLVKRFFGGIMGIIDEFAEDMYKAVPYSYTTLNSSPQAREFYKRTYKKWYSLSNETQNFYRKYVELFYLDGSGWKRVDEGDLERAESKYGFDKLRINFVKKDTWASILTVGLETACAAALQNTATYYSTNLTFNGPTSPSTPVSFAGLVGGNPKRRTRRSSRPKILVGGDPPIGVYADHTFVFQNDLPKIIGDFVIMYKPDTNGKLVPQAPTEGEFRKLYKTIREDPQASKKKYRESNKTLFSIHIPSLIRHSIQDIDFGEPSDVQLDDSEWDVPLDGLPTDDVVYIGNERYKVVVENGVVRNIPIELSRPLDEYFPQGKCYGTLVNGSTKDCPTFFKCIIDGNSDDAETCIEKLIASPNGFFNAAISEIKHLHPLLALQTLKRFGFDEYTEFDPVAGQDLRKVMGVKRWLKEKVPTTFGSATENMIRGNSNHILNYLNLLSQYVNANPKIMNISYNGHPSTGKTPVPPGIAGKLGLSYEIPIMRKSDYDAINLQFQSKLRRSAGPDPYGLKGPFAAFNGRILPFFGRPYPIQRGGGPNCDRAVASIKNNNGFRLGEYWRAIKTELAKKNHKLNNRDEVIIESRIERYLDEETSILKSLCQIDGYNDLLDAYKEHSPEIVSLLDVQKVVETFNKLHSKHESNEAALAKAFALIASKLDEAVEEAASRKINLGPR